MEIYVSPKTVKRTAENLKEACEDLGLEMTKSQANEVIVRLLTEHKNFRSLVAKREHGQTKEIPFLNLVREIANFSLEGELTEEGVPFDQTIDDTFDTFSITVQKARAEYAKQQGADCICQVAGVNKPLCPKLESKAICAACGRDHSDSIKVNDAVEEAVPLVGWYSSYGYQIVQEEQGGEILASAGNCPNNPTDIVPIDDALPIEHIRQNCEVAGLRLAEKYGVQWSDAHYDPMLYGKEGEDAESRANFVGRIEATYSEYGYQIYHSGLDEIVAIRGNARDTDMGVVACADGYSVDEVENLCREAMARLAKSNNVPLGDISYQESYNERFGTQAEREYAKRPELAPFVNTIIVKQDIVQWVRNNFHKYSIKVQLNAASRFRVVAENYTDKTLPQWGNLDLENQLIVAIENLLSEELICQLFEEVFQIKFVSKSPDSWRVLRDRYKIHADE